MSYIGYVPAAKPLTSADITDGIITNADIASGAAIAQSKIAGSFGKVLQVVQATNTTDTSTTSTSFVTANLSTSITPSSSSNKILILMSGTINANAEGRWCEVTVYRGGTDLATGSRGFNGTYVYGAVDIHTPTNISYLDSPSTTSSTTYTIYFKAYGGSGTIKFNQQGGTNTLTLIEIAG